MRPADRLLNFAKEQPLRNCPSTLGHISSGRAVQGGPAETIKVCNQIVPDIAKQLSENTGWNIRRTSLKTRNPANQPD